MNWIIWEKIQILLLQRRICDVFHALTIKKIQTPDDIVIFWLEHDFPGKILDTCDNHYEKSLYKKS